MEKAKCKVTFLNLQASNRSNWENNFWPQKRRNSYISVFTLPQIRLTRPDEISLFRKKDDWINPDCFRACISLSQFLMKSGEDNCFDITICLFNTNDIMFNSKSRWPGSYIFRLNRWKGDKTLQWGQNKNSFWLVFDETILWKRGKKKRETRNYLFFFLTKMKVNLFELFCYKSSNWICSTFYGWVLRLNISVLFDSIKRKLC